MFPSRYFPQRYFAPRYFPPHGGVPPSPSPFLGLTLPIKEVRADIVLVEFPNNGPAGGLTEVSVLRSALPAGSQPLPAQRLRFNLDGSFTILTALPLQYIRGGGLETTALFPGNPSPLLP